MTKYLNTVMLVLLLVLAADIVMEVHDHVFVVEKACLRGVK